MPGILADWGIYKKQLHFCLCRVLWPLRPLQVVVGYNPVQAKLNSRAWSITLECCMCTVEQSGSNSPQA